MWVLLQNEKRSSIQDEEELRAKLLQDMALRKTREANQRKWFLRKRVNVNRVAVLKLMFRLNDSY